MQGKDAAMECLYDETCEPTTWTEAEPALPHEFDCARGVFYGLVFVVPFWIAIVAAVAAL
jgi:hypothetical protein